MLKRVEMIRTNNKRGLAVKYQDIRPLIRSGDLLAWTHKGWSTWDDIQIQLVRFFTQSEYSHVGIAYVMGERVFILEAVAAGVKLTPLSENLPFFLIQTGMQWSSLVEASAMEIQGQKYSKWEAIKAFFVKLKPGKNKVWECAEYVIYILNVAGYPIDCKATPTAVIEWFQNNLDAPLYTITL
jgi:hypothetical protein